MEKIVETLSSLNNCINTLESELIKMISEHQGSKGFILTNDIDSRKTVIWVLVNDHDFIDTMAIKAVRVKNGNIEIIPDNYCIIYGEDAVRNYEESEWISIHNHEFYLYNVIYDLAMYLYEYID